MNSQSIQDRADAELRALLAQNDPLSGETSQAPEALLARIRSEIAHSPLADGNAEPDSAHGRNGANPQETWLRRHWQGSLMAAACVVSIMLAAGVLLPTLFGSFSSSVEGVTARDEAVSELATAGTAAPAAPTGPGGDASTMLQEQPTTGAAAAGDVGTQSSDTAVSAPQLARSASVLVGTDDIAAQRDTFVAEILAMGGRVMSESTITANSSERGNFSSSGGDVYPQSGAVVAPDSDYSYPTPYPWYPSGPGVWLSVEVPVAEYDRAIDAARATGEVVRLEQSSSDVGTQMADIDGRIAALESSLARLTALMGQATSVSDVIALEEAISQRQAELDSLRAQQKELASQTAMSRVSLTLMSVADAKASVSPPTSGTWWDAFGDGLGQLWLWFGKALLIVSPLLLAVCIIAWARRWRHRSAPTATTTESRETVPPNPA